MTYMGSEQAQQRRSGALAAFPTMPATFVPIVPTACALMRADVKINNDHGKRVEGSSRTLVRRMPCSLAAHHTIDNAKPRLSLVWGRTSEYMSTRHYSLATPEVTMYLHTLIKL